MSLLPTTLLCRELTFPQEKFRLFCFQPVALMILELANRLDTHLDPINCTQEAAPQGPTLTTSEEDMVGQLH